MRRLRRPASLRALPARARRPVGMGCTLMLGLALATVGASDPVSAEQAGAGAPPAHSATGQAAAHSAPGQAAAHATPAQPASAPAAAAPAAPAAAAPQASPAAGPAPAVPAAASGAEPSKVPYEPVAGAVSAAPAGASAAGSSPAGAGSDPVGDVGAQATQAGGGTAPPAVPAPSASPSLPAAPAAAASAAAPSPATAPSRAAPQASAAPKGRSLLPLVQPLWSELSDSQRKILAPLESQWNTLTQDEKRPWLALAARLPKMDAPSRARAEKRIREWAALTPEQRRLARNNYRLAKQLPKDQRVATWEQYQQMTPEQQAVLRQAGWTSNTAARHAGAPTGLAKEAAQPLWRRLFKWIWDPEKEQPAANGKPAGGAAK